MLSYTKLVDNLRVHSSAGTLSTEVAARRRPHERTISRITDIVQPEVHIQLPSAQLNLPYQRSILLAKSYSNFRPAPGDHVHPLALVASMASMLTNIIDPANVFRGNEMREAFHEAGISMRVSQYNTPEDIAILSHNEDVIRFLEEFEDDTRAKFMNERDQQILCVGIILLTIGKSVNPQNYDGWLRNRIRTFEGALGILPDLCIWSVGQCPTQESLAACYSFLSASFSLRRLFFRICIASARADLRVAAIFREVVMFLQGVEMGHIIMIDRYIFAKYPELLRIRALRDNMEAMNNAWTYLSSLEPGERFFVKLLYNKDQTAPLNRNNFSLLATAAIAAAQTEIPSMRFYQGGNVTGTTGALIETVKQYLNLRLNLSYISIVHSAYAYMSEEEKKKYLEHAEALALGIATLDQQPVEIPLAERQLPRFERN